MELIDKRLLGECHTCTHHEQGGCDTYCDHGESYRLDMRTLETVDAVPVVRCKDCKHQRIYKKDVCVVCAILDVHVDGDFYCSYGERKDDDNHTPAGGAGD